jgi:hypothetical protein
VQSTSAARIDETRHLREARLTIACPRPRPPDLRHSLRLSQTGDLNLARLRRFSCARMRREKWPYGPRRARLRSDLRNTESDRVPDPPPRRPAEGKAVR